MEFYRSKIGKLHQKAGISPAPATQEVKKYRAIKIDVTKREVYEIEFDGTLSGLYQALDCQTVERVQLTGKDDLWMDEEALCLNPQPEKFSFAGIAQPVAGHGLICGFDGEGASIGTDLDLDQIKGLIDWLGDRDVKPDIRFIGFDE